MNKRRIKPLLPSLREKKRYLVFEILSEHKLSDFSPIQRQVWQTMLQLYGEAGMANMGLWILPDKYHLQSQTGILRAGHHAIPQVKAALSFIQTIGNEPVIVRSKTVSGILKKAEKANIYKEERSIKHKSTISNNTTTANKTDNQNKIPFSKNR